MTLSERTYQALLVVYPSDHRRVYGDQMVQLFRDRMRRDGGGLRTLTVWTQMSFDLAASAFKERVETIMAVENSTDGESAWESASAFTKASYLMGAVILGSFLAQVAGGIAFLLVRWTDPPEGVGRVVIIGAFTVALVLLAFWVYRLMRENYEYVRSAEYADQNVE